jgi:hypothetical protein
MIYNKKLNIMKNTKLEEGVEDIRAVVMTTDEKERVREHILSASIVDVKQKSIRSPLTVSLFLMKKFKKIFTRKTIA